MAISKVVYGNDTLIDISGDTVTAADLKYGVTAHGSDGTAITGAVTSETTHTIGVTASANSGNTITSNGTYTISGTYTDSAINKIITNITANASGSVVVDVTPTLQTKSVTLSGSSQTISADAGYDGLSSVTVPAVSGDAGQANVLSGKSFSSASFPTGSTGTMTNKGKWEYSLSPGGRVTVPAGYHNGTGSVACTTPSTQTKSSTGLLAGDSVTVTPDSGKLLTSVTVSAASLSSQTAGTATASQILSGYTAWVGGTKLTGSYVAPTSYAFGSPSKKGYGSQAKNATVSVSVTSKPKLIIWTTSNTSSTILSVYVYDTVNNAGWRIVYNGSTATTNAALTSSNISTVFSTISASSVVKTSVSTSYTYLYNYLFWY